MRAVPFGEVSNAEWNTVVQRSSDAWLFHDAAWIAIESTYFPNHNRSFALVAGGELVGVQPLYVCDQGIGWVERLVHCGVHRHTGLALVDGLDAGPVKAARKEAIRHMASVAAAERADRIQLNAQNLAPANLSLDRAESPFWLEHGFHFGLQFGPAGLEPAPGMSTCCVDLIVDLTGTEEQLFAALQDRNAVRKAMAAGVTLEAGGADAIEAYVEIAIAAAERTGEALPSRDYFAELERAFAPSGRIAVLFARHEDRRVAAALLAIDKAAASYLGGCSLPEAMPLRVNDFLQWSVQVWGRGRGLHRYRLGPHFPDVPPDWPIAKVTWFKTKFGARSVPVIQGSRFLSPGKYQSVGTARLNDYCSRSTSPL
jgi:hypothetical protein